MDVLDAVNRAAEMLKAVGFVHKCTSLTSISTYYRFSDKEGVLRIGTHGYDKEGRKSLGLDKVFAIITITPDMAKNLGDIHIENMVAHAIGLYFLRDAGIVAMPGKRKRRQERLDREKRDRLAQAANAEQDTVLAG